MNVGTKHRNVVILRFAHDNQKFDNISQEIFAAEVKNITGNQDNMVIVWRNNNHLIA